MTTSMISLYRGAVFCCVLCITTSLPVFSQDEIDFPLTTKEIKRVTNRFFGNLVTSNTSSGVLGNFASIDPAGSSFKFQGTTAIGGGDTSKKHPQVSFFSFSAKGDLFGQQFGALFSNSSLNTGISLSASYHILMCKPKVTLSLSSAANYAVLRSAAYRQFTRTADQLMAADDSVVIAQRLALVNKDLELTDTAIARAKRVRVNLVAQIDTASLLTAKLLVDSASKNEDVLAALEKKLTGILVKRDSLGIAQQESFFLSSFGQSRAEEALNIINDSLLMAFPLAKHAFSWLSFTGGGGKQNYATYDANAVFDRQIQKADFNTYHFGVSLNFFKKNMLKSVIQYYNVGVSRQRTNNIDFLSPKAITDTRKIVNSVGDVTRVVERKYNAYSDPIIQDEGWKFFLNRYILFGKKPSGIHIFPELNFQDNKTTLFHMGLGYIISFVNTKKDQPVINAEVFFKFLDMTDQGGSTIAGVWNRNQIGVNFTLPFNLFTK